MGNLSWSLNLVFTIPAVSTAHELTSVGRETFLVVVEWHDDWPIFNGGKNVTLETQGRASLTSTERVAPTMWQADLSRESLELGWYQKSEKPRATGPRIFLTKRRHPSEAMFQLNREAWILAVVRKLLRSVQSRGTSHASKKAVVTQPEIYREHGVQTDTLWL